MARFEYHSPVYRKSGFGTQRVPGRMLKGLQTGYVKILYAREVIDRALTKKRALEIVRRMEKEGPLFNMKPASNWRPTHDI